VQGIVYKHIANVVLEQSFPIIKKKRNKTKNKGKKKEKKRTSQYSFKILQVIYVFINNFVCSE